MPNLCEQNEKSKILEMCSILTSRLTNNCQNRYIFVTVRPRNKQKKQWLHHEDTENSKFWVTESFFLIFFIFFISNFLTTLMKRLSAANWKRQLGV